jgi:CRISPR-associated endonuclease/helicase Cas3
VHAGLLGADALILIDEAHLVSPFKSLVAAAAKVDRPHPVPSMRLISLSATGVPAPDEAVFRLEAEDHDEEPVKRRLEAPKRLAIHSTDDLVKSLVDRAFELGRDGSRVVVFCNSRDRVAREVAERLTTRSRLDWKDRRTTALLVGARRVLERERLTGHSPRDGLAALEPDEVLRRFMAGASSEDAHPAFLVATSAGEVGVDLDADHMVCDLVAWERMVQRLGRVNRSGRDQPAMVDVFWSPTPAKSVKDDAEDAGEDERLSALKAPFESDIWPQQEDGRRPAGPAVLAALKSDPTFAKLIEAATTPEPLRPALTRPNLDAWAMTSLEHHSGRPRIEPWLRGWVDTLPQTRLVWRRMLTVSDTEDMLRDEDAQAAIEELFEELPPHVSETLETYTYLAVEITKARANDIRKRTGDVPRDLARLCAVTLDARGELEELFPLRELAETDAARLLRRFANRTLIIDARLGGLSIEGLLDRRAAHEPTTLDALAPADADEPGWSEAMLRRVGRRLRRVALKDEPADGWLRQAGWPISAEDGDDGGSEWRVEKRADAPEIGNPAITSRAQALDVHHAWTVQNIAAIAADLDLPEDYRRMLEIAGGVHDLGKARDVWQSAMGADPKGRPYAKTRGNRANPALLEGYRHEFGSLRDAAFALDGIEDETMRELANHLVLAHHGFARPVIKPFDPEEPPSSSLVRTQEAARRFARLQEKWGPWGLAWWESLLRAADWAASARLTKTDAR